MKTCPNPLTPAEAERVKSHLLYACWVMGCLNPIGDRIWVPLGPWAAAVNALCSLPSLSGGLPLAVGVALPGSFTLHPKVPPSAWTACQRNKVLLPCLRPGALLPVLLPNCQGWAWPETTFRPSASPSLCSLLHSLRECGLSYRFYFGSSVKLPVTLEADYPVLS